MTYILHHGRRGVAALLCVYMIVINGLAMGEPTEVDGSVKKTSQPKDIAYYAGHIQCDRQLAAFEKLYGRTSQMYHELWNISLEIPKYKGSPESIIEIRKEWEEVMQKVEIVIRESKKFIDLKILLDDYRTALEALHRDNPQKSALPTKEMIDLERKFKGREELAEIMISGAALEHYIKYAQDAWDFIRKHKPEESSPPSKAPAAASEKAEAEKGSKDEKQTEKAAAGGEAATNVRSASDEKKSSGHLIVGVRAIQTTLALYLISIL